MIPSGGWEEVVLEEGELRLRPPRLEEAPLYARWWADPEVQFGFCSEARTVEEIAAAFPEMEAEARDIGHWIDFVLEVNGKPAGYLWFSHWDLDARRIELNLLIAPRYRGRGLARRAIRRLLGWAFPRMDLLRVDLCPRDDHLPAIRSYRGAGARMGEIRDEVVHWRGESVCFRELYFLREDFVEPGSGGD